ncbi:MAG TPA: M48 family metallopeptidase [Pirellulaceae bacterium]|nr:M48 family metallopeptidase [Pirellulaceae bacterium]
MTTALRERPKRRTDVYAFKQRVRAWADRIGVQAKEIHVRGMTKKWASCSTSGRVTFSADLLRMEHDWQEYVIVHELLHLRVPNHGKLFKALLGAFLPDWERVVSRHRGDGMGRLGLGPVEGRR